MDQINNNTLQAFLYQEKNIRTVIKNGEIWWVLKDICDVLNLSTPARVAERLGKDEVSRTHLIDSIGRIQETLIIGESGLYKVILRSDKPESKKFMNWITREVLPSIRQHGAYITKSKVEELLNDPGTWAELLLAVQKEQMEKRLLLKKTEQLETKIEHDAPKILFADSVSASDDTILIGELAKILKGNGYDIGQNRLFEKLRQHRFLIKRDAADYNMPTQKAMEFGVFKIKETAITHSNGNISISKTVKVTGKGQQYFIDVRSGLKYEAKLWFHSG